MAIEIKNQDDIVKPQDEQGMRRYVLFDRPKQLFMAKSPYIKAAVLIRESGRKVEDILVFGYVHQFKVNNIAFNGRGSVEPAIPSADSQITANFVKELPRGKRKIKFSAVG